MPAHRTAFQGYSVKFSPFDEGRLAVAAAQNFGRQKVGNEGAEGAAGVQNGEPEAGGDGA